METAFWFIYSIASGILYRMGGSDKFNAKWRDLGTPACGYLLLSYIMGINLICSVSFWLSYLLAFASMTTYWKCLNKHFKKPDTDCYWFNWLAHGLFAGISAFPLYTLGISLYALFIRTVVLSIGTMAWSEYQGNAVQEEFGRGFLFTATIPLLNLCK